MPKFDVGIEARIKFRYKAVDASRGEAARDHAEAVFTKHFGKENVVIERSFFEDSSPETIAAEEAKKKPAAPASTSPAKPEVKKP